MTYQIAHLRLSNSPKKGQLSQLLYQADGPDSFTLRSTDVPGAFAFSVQAFSNFFTWQGSSEVERSIALRSTREDFCFKASSRRQYVAKVGRRNIEVNQSYGCIIKYDQNSQLDISADSVAYGFGISRKSVVGALQKLHAIPIPINFAFDPVVDMSRPHIATMNGMLRFFQEDALNNHSLARSAVALAMFEEAVSMFVVQNFRHSLSDVSVADHWLAPAQVRRAMEFAAANAAQPITVSDMAAAAGVSVRALQTNFQRFIHRSPLEFLRELRLQYVHAELLATEHNGSVAKVAEKWGFLNHGRFAALYRRVYGKLPSEDLGARAN